MMIDVTEIHIYWANFVFENKVFTYPAQLSSPRQILHGICHTRPNPTIVNSLENYHGSKISLESRTSWIVPRLAKQLDRCELYPTW